MLRVPLLRTGLQAVPEEGGGSRIECPPPPLTRRALQAVRRGAGGGRGAPTSHATATATTVAADHPSPYTLAPVHAPQSNEACTVV